MSDRPKSFSFAEPQSPIFQMNHMSSSSHLVAVEGPKFMRDTFISDTLVEKPSSGITSVEKSDAVAVKENKLFLQSPVNLNLKPSLPTVSSTQTPTFLRKVGEELDSSKETALLVTDSSKNRPLTSSSFPELEGKHGFPISLTSAASGTQSLLGKAQQLDTARSNSQTHEKVSAFPTFSLSFSATPSSLSVSSPSPPTSLSISSSTAQTSSFVMPISKSFTNSSTTSDAYKTISTSSSLAFASPVLPSSATLPHESPKPPALLFSPSPTKLSTSESPKTELQASSKSDTDTATQVPSMQPASSKGETDMKPKPSVSTTSVTKTATELQPSNSDADNASQVPATQSGPYIGAFDMKFTSLVSTTPLIKTSTTTASASQLIFASAASPAPSITLKNQPEQPSSLPTPFPTQQPTSPTVSGAKTESFDVSNTNDDDMDEEAPESTNATDLNLGSLGGFGLGSTPHPSAPKSNPFGGSFGNSATNVSTSPFTMNVPSGELFRPASFSFQSPQAPQTSQPVSSGAFSGGFVTGTTAQSPTSGFGQPSQIGQQALGSVLGSFGQSRQLGASLPGAGFGSPSGIGGGFAASSSSGGFSSAVSGGGFANIGSTAGGFGNLASTGNGFAAAASGGGGFAAAASGGGGFTAAASGGSGGFGAAASGGSGFGGVASAGGGFGGLASAGGGFGGAASAGGGFGGAASAGEFPVTVKCIFFFYYRRFVVLTD